MKKKASARAISIKKKTDGIERALNELRKELRGSVPLSADEFLACVRVLEILGALFKNHFDAVNALEKTDGSGIGADDAFEFDFSLSYFTGVLTGLIKALTNYADSNADSVLSELRVMVEWPVLLSPESEWDVRRVGVNETRYDLIFDELGMRSDVASIPNSYALWAKEFEQVILLRTADSEALELPWFLDNKNMNGLGRVSSDDYSVTDFPKNERCSDAFSDPKVQESLIRMASAIKYFLYMVISPLPMREWLWTDWIEYRVSAWKRVTGEEAFQERDSCESKYSLTWEVLREKCGVDDSDGTREGWKAINIDKGCRYYFGDFEDFSSLINDRDEGADVAQHKRFEKFCRKVIDGYFRWKGESQGIAAGWLTRSNKLRISDVPKPSRGWTRLF